MKKIICFLLAGMMILGFTSCMTVGDMNPPDSFTENRPAGNNKTPEETVFSEVTSEETQNNDVPPVVEPPKVEETVIKFVAAGDALIHSAIYWEAEDIASSMSGYSGNYYFKGMYENIADEIREADIAFVNHEAPIADTTISGYPNFNAPSESGDALVDLGFNVINIANNHMFDVDHKVTGYADTIKYWDSKDVLQIGGYKSQADYDNVRILSIDGVNIAFLSYTYFTNPGTNLNSSSANAGYVAPIAKDATIIKHIASAKQKADLVFVSMHWGSENIFNATAEQKRLAQLIADNGADVIIGHHSHTVQPVEWITGSSGNKTLCIYSLGNLISGMLSSKNHVGGLMTFDIVKKNGQISIQNPIFKPTVCHYNIANFNQKAPDGYPVRTGFKVYMMEDYTEELAKKHGVQNYGAFTLATMQNYAKNTISSEFLPDYLK